MNIQTGVLLAVIVVLMLFALRRAYRVFSLKDDCCGGGPKDTSKRARVVKIDDADESNYGHVLDLQIGGMTCEKCVERVQNAINAMDAGNVWARVNLEAKSAHILSKSELSRDAVEAAVEQAGYYVSHR